MTLRVNQSTQHIGLACRGQGLEPRLEFARAEVAFGPILPHSQGDTQEVTVKNPCSFPIEMYSIEFDKVYLEEEMVRRVLNVDFDCISLHTLAAYLLVFVGEGK